MLEQHLPCEGKCTVSRTPEKAGEYEAQINRCPRCCPSDQLLDRYNRILKVVDELDDKAFEALLNVALAMRANWGKE